jgi:predicted nucleic acid-binding protein
MCLVETDIVINLLSGREPSMEFFASEHSEARVAISTITISELYAGVDLRVVPPGSSQSIDSIT